MAPLRSCYFCGEAVGAALDEHSIPADAPDDDQVTVTLCSTCKGKLDQLLAHLHRQPGDVADDEFDGAENGTATGPAASESGDATASGEAAGDDESREASNAGGRSQSGSERSASADEPAGASGPGAGASGASPTDPAGDGAVADPASVEQDPIFATDEGTLLESEEADDADAAEAAGADSDAAPGQAGDATAAPVDGATDDAAATESADAAGNASSAETATEAESTSRSVDETAAASADASSDADDPLANVSTRTYNRVVRLLQNREFPVDRAEFETLATNAYEMEPDECATALDAIVEKGLLEERDGKFYRPD